MTPVRSTHRLQFHRDFTFADAQAHLGYFAALGISHLYASPITTSQPGSTHGYDTVDYTRVNPELGGEAGLRSLVAALRERGMGLIVDIVPNHMGVGGAHNAWWLDILEWGRHAAHARFFDVDWHSPDPALRGKVLAPFLGESFGNALAEGKLELRFDADDGRFFAAYYDHRFPICPVDYPRILARASDPACQALASAFESLGYQSEDQERAAAARASLVAKAAATPGAFDSALAAFSSPDPASRDALQRLLDKQHYRLAWWRSASDEVNWRRFFDISALAGMRVERAEVFDASHALILRLYAQGVIDGVRIDHVDGLAEPREYCQRLRARLDIAHAQRPAELRVHPPYLVIEKILARGEGMRGDWKINGTTGYDFLNDVGALLHDADSAAPLAAIWAAGSGRSPSFEAEALPARRKILAENLAAELDRATRALHRIARESLSTRDYAFGAIRRVLTELVVHFPVYRIYPIGAVRTPEDEPYFAAAREGARAALPRADHDLLAQIDEWLGGGDLTPAPSSPSTAPSTLQDVAATEAALSSTERTSVPEQALADGHAAPRARSAAPRSADERAMSGRHEAARDPRIVQRRIALTLFSQLTSPAAAKSVEDTACYRYGRLISRNEVGADPDDFALSPDAFHALNADRAKQFPHAMLTTATHDHKRGEDVRARIAVLSELPDLWGSTWRRWRALNAPLSAPSAGFESMLYQTLIGCWPADLSTNDAAGVESLAKRVAAWQQKAQREAKLDTDWFAPNQAYEDTSHAFLFAILSPQHRQGFLASLVGFVDAIAPVGAINSLQQTLLRLTSPGVPDLYQGTDYWDMSLVDPDNRRPVDYDMRAKTLAESRVPLGQLLPHWRDGRIKQAMIHRALALRQRVPALFLDGRYVPIEVVGEHARSVMAFARVVEGNGDAASDAVWSITVVTRLAAQLLDVARTAERLSATPGGGGHGSDGNAGAEPLGSGATAGLAPAATVSDNIVLPLVPPARWGDTALLLPAALSQRVLFDQFGEEQYTIPRGDDATQSDRGIRVLVAQWLGTLPVALLSTVKPE